MPKSGSEKKPPTKSSSPDKYRKITNQLIQCTTCNKFIKGNLTHFDRHLKTHSTTRKKFKCPACFKLLSRKDNLKKHARTFHDLEITIFEHVTVPVPPVEPVKPWQPPFESVPRFRIRPADQPWLEKKHTDIDRIIRKMTKLPRPISPLPDDQPDDLPPSVSASTETVCQDEIITMTDTEVFVYSVYGLFN